MENTYLTSVIKQLKYYKQLGERCMLQLADDQLLEQINPEANSIAMIVNHLVGNMKSRWTDFLTSDGEKSWRNREQEFENISPSREQLLQLWNDGWSCLFNAIEKLEPADLEKIIYIRNMGHSVTEAINRQLMHYGYHIGQIVFIGKTLKESGWESLSIAKGQSAQYNKQKFSREKSRQHFTDEFLEGK